MLFTVLEKSKELLCQLCLQKKETVVKVRFGDGFRVKCCTECLWQRADKLKGEKNADSK